jgi:protein TonB
MELNKIMNADLIDILFDGKNKEYGAYELRKTYNKRITIAMTGMAIFCLLFILTQLLANDNDKLRNTIEVTDLHLPNFKTEETPEPLPVKPPKAIPEPVATTQYVTPIINVTMLLFSKARLAGADNNERNWLAGLCSFSQTGQVLQSLLL